MAAYAFTALHEVFSDLLQFMLAFIASYQRSDPAHRSILPGFDCASISSCALRLEVECEPDLYLKPAVLNDPWMSC